MKRTTITAVSVAALGLSGVAIADQHDPSLDLVINVPDFDLGPEGDFFTFTINLEPNPNPVIGFTFQGDFASTAGSPWASDMRLDIDPPGGEDFFAGGFPSPGGEHNWDFQGSGSSDDGTYTSTHFPSAWAGGISKGGDWTFTFTNDFGAATGHGWSNVSITLHKVPAPGVLALLGVAGLVGCRRRR